MFLITGTLLGPFYTLFTDPFEEYHAYISAAIIGFLIALVVALLEVWWLDKGIKYIRFIYLTLIRTFIYMVFITIIVSNVLIISRMIRFDLTYTGVLVSEEWIHYILFKDYAYALIYGLVFALSVNFTKANVPTVVPASRSPDAVR